MLTLLLLLLVALLYLGWVLIFVSLPLMALAVPDYILERLMRGGWQRYVLFRIGTLPSLHVRKAVYRLLGAHIGKHVVFHFKTEIRAPHFLFVGGGNNR